MKFKLTADFLPTGDQPQAISKLTQNINEKIRNQVLLGVTGSGKTFTLANVIANINMPVLIISHNKTLAAQLYQEFKTFFPQNAVSYFVSYYDYYQPEAYIPQTDTYIEKETDINEEIDKLRLAATTNILTRSDTITVASVSAIYNIGSPKEYGSFILELKKGVAVTIKSVISRLVELQYVRGEYELKRGGFRIRANIIDIYPAYMDIAYRIEFDTEKIIEIAKINPVSSDILETNSFLVLYPAKHFMTDTANTQAYAEIKNDLDMQIKLFKKQNKLIEAQRISQKVNYDLEMIQTVGYVNGIENYSRYFDNRKKGDPPYSLLDYYQQKYQDNWLLLIDESHMTIPQIRGMYQGDKSRKETLINFGFRLPSALDNRPLNFAEFQNRIPFSIYVSATPNEWEISNAQTIVEQLLRPTGICDPQIFIKPVKNQIADLISEIKKRSVKKERVLVTTLTKKTAEDLSTYLKEKGIKVEYLHSDILTLERTDILDKLRSGEFDALIGINLLREGLDLPEVSLVAILDADKEGFLRSEVALIQTMGRAARHIQGTVIMYADNITKSIKNAVMEVDRRRKIQIDYNQKNNIIPISITKPIRNKLIIENIKSDLLFDLSNDSNKFHWLKIKPDSLTPTDKSKLIKKLEREMKLEALEMNFELAAQIRDKIMVLRQK